MMIGRCCLCSQACEGIGLWDDYSVAANSHWYSSTPDGQTLMDWGGNSTFTVDENYLPSTVKMVVAGLSRITIVSFPFSQALWDFPETAGEISVMENYINAGGTLYIKGHYTVGQPTLIRDGRTSVNSFLSTIGSTMSWLDTSFYTPLYLNLVNTKTHSLTSGVTSLLPRACGKIDPGSGAELLNLQDATAATIPDWPVIAVESIGSGMVILDVARDVYQETAGTTGDRQPFINNILAASTCGS
jgi:hypothetical protein